MNSMDAIWDWIAECVIRGDVQAAQRAAEEYALLRDERPTPRETEATLRAMMTA